MVVHIKQVRIETYCHSTETGVSRRTDNFKWWTETRGAICKSDAHLVPTFYLFCARIFRFRVQKPRVVKRSYVAAIFVAKRVYSLSLVFSYVPRRRVAAYNAVFLF